MIINRPHVEYGLRLLDDSGERDWLIEKLIQQIPRLWEFLNNIIEQEIQRLRPNEKMFGALIDLSRKTISFALGVLYCANNNWLPDFTDYDFENLNRIYTQETNSINKRAKQARNKTKQINPFFYNQLCLLLEEYTLKNSCLKNLIWFIIVNLIENLDQVDQVLENVKKQ